MNIPPILNWRSVTIALLISLLLHISIVLYVALEKSGFQLPFLQKQNEQELPPEEKKYKKDTEWAETKGRSSYGAPVLFRDEPDDEIMPTFAKAMADKPDFTQIPAATQDETDDTTDEKTINQNQVIEQSGSEPKVNQITQENKQTEETPIEEKLDITSSVTKAMENKQDATSFETLRSVSAKASTDAIRHSFSDGGQAQDERAEDRQGEREENKPENRQPDNKPLFVKTVQTIPQATKQQVPNTTTSRTGLSAVALAKAGKPIAMTKQIPSLAQLTQGVLNYVKDEGQYAVSMIGKKGGIPSNEQMKYERFLQKLSHCLQTSFSINNDRFPQCDPSVSSIEIFLALNKDGTLHNLRLVKTSGDPRVDSFMMFAFRDASSSFPTVPHYLPHNPFSITYVIDISPTRSNMNIYRR